MDNINKMQKIFESYDLTMQDQIEIYNIVKNIFLHDEFQRRMSNEFLHHGSTTLGEHILKDTALTYILSRKFKNDPKYSLKCALVISMMHDLYTRPWQNAGHVYAHQYNRHGFRHPIEAVINSATWFEDMFKDEKESKIIIDGITHHMFPFPVTYYYDNDENALELVNFEESKKLPENIKTMLNQSTLRGKIGPVSCTPSMYKEGRIMSLADKKSSNKEIQNTCDFNALFTENNSNLGKK